MTKPKFLLIENNEDLVRDVESNAILNADITSLQNYKKNRKKQKQMNAKLEEIEGMKKDINDIKSLLLKIIERDKN